MSTDGGSTFCANVRVDDDLTGENQDRPDIAVDDFGRIFVVWTDERNGGLSNADIYFASSLDGGNTFCTNKRINSDNTTELQYQPSIAVSETGNIGIAWKDCRDVRNGSIYFVNSTDGGITFSENMKINDFIENTYVAKPSIACRGNGVYIVWEDTRGGKEKNIYFGSYGEIQVTEFSKFFVLPIVIGALFIVVRARSN